MKYLILTTVVLLATFILFNDVNCQDTADGTPTPPSQDMGPPPPPGRGPDGRGPPGHGPRCGKGRGRGPPGPPPSNQTGVAGSTTAAA